MPVQVLAGYWDFNVKTRELLLCPRSRQMFGIEGPSPKKLGKNDWEPRVHPDDLEVIACELDAAGRRNDTYSARFRTLCPDGSLREILGVGRASASDRKRFIGLNFDVVETVKAAQKEAQLGGTAIESLAAPPVGVPNPANENKLRARRLRSSARDSLTPVRTKEDLKREHLLMRAQGIIRHRELRKRFLNPGMFGEPAFDVLLALYVTKAARLTLSVRALSMLIGASESVVTGWLRFLSNEGLALCFGVEQDDPGAVTAALTEKGRTALEGYLGAFDGVDGFTTSV